MTTFQPDSILLNIDADYQIDALWEIELEKIVE